ncbi:hypothetical protein XH98_35440 [Bradyrhizobium sp. CCBAU 51745]|nr:hypothetical protein [Bradyrhizobium sp. CCBAU 51745]
MAGLININRRCKTASCPDVVPVGYAEEPQPSWAILTAFASCAIASTATLVAIITTSLLVGTKLYRTLFGAVTR